MSSHSPIERQGEPECPCSYEMGRQECPRAREGREDDHEVYTPREAAAYLRISRTSCYESLRSGALKPIAVRWGRKYLIPKAALRNLIDGSHHDAA